MSLYRLITGLSLSLCCWLLLIAAVDEVAKPPTAAPAAAAGAAVKPALNTTTAAAAGANSTDSGGKRRGGLGGFSVDSSMIQRALYVLIAITLIGVLYFLVRAVRLKKPAPKKKYGLLSNYDDSVEMEGVESEEDDTLYEARGLRR